MIKMKNVLNVNRTTLQITLVIFVVQITIISLMIFVILNKIFYSNVNNGIIKILPIQFV